MLNFIECFFSESIEITYFFFNYLMCFIDIALSRIPEINLNLFFYLLKIAGLIFQQVFVLRFICELDPNFFLFLFFAWHLFRT